jgi:serine/threonine-protein kinase HipA
LLTEKAASEIIESQIAGIRERFASVSEEASLSAIDQSVLWGRVFLNPYVFEGAPARLTALERRT